VEFIDTYKGFKEPGSLMWRVGSMCKTLSKDYGVSFSPSTYHAYKRRKSSARSINDERLTALILQSYDDNYECYGAKKMWHDLLNAGEKVARCTVERLMRQLRLRGERRGKVKQTTKQDKNAKAAEDLVKRSFYADEPNKLWVADFTYVSTWQGWCHTAFVVDVFARRIVGHKVSVLMDEAMVASAFGKAVWMRANEGHAALDDLVHHSDKGSQYTADNFNRLLRLHGIKTSMGSVGDSYDNALAETINGAYKTELIKKRGPWKTIEQLEYETAKWVDWFNNKRISEYNNYQSPKYIEQMWYSSGVDARKGSKKGKA
jgi:putative transposase